MNRQIMLSKIILIGFIIVSFAFNIGAEIKISNDNYIIYSPRENKIVDIKDIIEQTKKSTVIIFGEEHNDPVAHYLEYLFLERLYETYGDKLTLSLEMFERDVQLVLNEYLTGLISEKHFQKDCRVWTNYKDYRPLIEFARSNQIPVIAANAPYRYSNIASTKGQKALTLLSNAAKIFIAPLPYDTATGTYYQKLLSVKKNMPPPLPKKIKVQEDTLKKMKMPTAMPDFKINQGQSLWDATMAYSIAQYLRDNKDKKILHINGRFHSDQHFGVVQQLKKYAPAIKVMVISAFPDSAFPEVKFDTYKDIADYLIITDPSLTRTFK